jgi:transposase-like protein
MKYPPFCPNPDCEKHTLKHRNKDWYDSSGYYATSVSGRIHRYRCRICGMRFSDQSFSIDYAAKRKLPYDYILKQLKSAAGIRDIARDLKVSPTTIQNRISRLSRQAVAVHTELKGSIRLNEDLVSDGFESFAVSQYFPNNIHLLAGKDSQYLYAFDYAHLSRKGRMTESQKRKNLKMKKKLQGGTTISKSFMNICKQIDLLLERSSKEHTVLFTDEKPQYRSVLSVCGFSRDFSHVTVNSKIPRTLTNDLFSVNYLDREIRKDNANHVRQTVQFSRNVNNAMERLAVYSLYHNYIKPYRINTSKNIVHAEAAGVDRKKINSELKSLFTFRRFYSRIKNLTDTDMRLWLKGFMTPGKTGYEYVPKYAWL